MRSVSCKAGCVQKQPNSQPAVHSAKRCAPTAGDLRSVPVETPAAHECEKKRDIGTGERQRTAVEVGEIHAKRTQPWRPAAVRTSPPALQICA